MTARTLMVGWGLFILVTGWCGTRLTDLALSEHICHERTGVGVFAVLRKPVSSVQSLVIHLFALQPPVVSERGRVWDTVDVQVVCFIIALALA